VAKDDWSEEDRKQLNRQLAKVGTAIYLMQLVAAGNYFVERLQEAHSEADEAVNGKGA
jgi:hypothetical protein